jgi:UDP-2,3-diacylglucosamine pyrophosphatase LpxH
MKKTILNISKLCLALLFLLSGLTLAQGNQFKFIVISDIHISNDESKDQKLVGFIDEINKGKLSDAEFLVITGDNVSSYYASRNNGDGLENNRAIKLMAILKNLEKPYLIALGNHDYKIDRDKDSDAPFTFDEINNIEMLWKEHAEVEPYYSIDHGDIRFIILNSMRGRYLNRSFDNEQINWLAEQMKEKKPTFLFFHHPIRTDNFRIWGKPKDLITPENEEKFFSILSKYKDKIKGIFVGHGHMWISDKLFNTIPVYETASFGEGKGLNYYSIEFDAVKQETIIIKNSK